jgi:hypothetical protein
MLGAVCSGDYSVQQAAAPQRGTAVSLKYSTGTSKARSVFLDCRPCALSSQIPRSTLISGPIRRRPTKQSRHRCCRHTQSARRNRPRVSYPQFSGRSAGHGEQPTERERYPKVFHLDLTLATQIANSNSHPPLVLNLVLHGTSHSEAKCAGLT